MSRRGLIALAIVAAAMAAYLVVDGRGRQDGERAAARTRMMPPFDRKAVRRIVIRRGKGDDVSIVHSAPSQAPPDAPTWLLDQIGVAPVDETAIDDLLAAVDLAESDRTADISPQEAGLQVPRAQITIETPAGKNTLQIGRVDATGRNVYARLGWGGPIRVIGSRVLELADRDADAFRDRRLFLVDAAAVTAIVWRDQSGVGELRKVDGRWKNGRDEWVANERVAESLRQLFALRIDRFEVRIAPTVVSPRAITLTAGATRVDLGVLKDGELIPGDGQLARGNDRLHVPGDAFEAAWRSLAAAAARDDRLLAIPPETVTSVTLDDGHRRLSLRRVRGTWTFAAREVAYAPDTEVVDAWLARLGTITDAIRSRGPNTRHLSADGRFHQEVDVSGPPSVLAVLAPDPLRFRERRVLSFARFDVRRLQRTAGKTTQHITTDDGGGSWNAFPGETADTASASQVVGALSDLRAEKFVESPPPGEPAVRLQIDLQPPGERQPLHQALRIFAAKEGCVAHLETVAIFTLERAACDALRLPLLKKTD